MKTILYKRVSTDEQADSGFSLQYQEQVLRQFCDFNKFEIVGVYTEDYSGKDFNRPEWIKLMNFLRKNRGNVDQVLCLRWDRWSRNLHYALDEIKKLSSLGVKINTVEQPIDIENPDSKVLLSLYLTLPEVENDKNSIRTTEGSRRARMEGCWTGSPPRGYDCIRNEEKKSTLVPNEKAKFIQMAFERMASGLYSANEVRIWLKNQGLYLPKQTFYHTIRNVAYMGKIYVKPWKKEPEQIVEGLHPAIVSEELFKKANRVLDGRVRQMDFESDKTDLYPVKGFMRCPKHGRTITAYKARGGNGQRKHYHYYICTRRGCFRYRVEEVHRKIEDLLGKISWTAGMVLVYKSALKAMMEKDFTGQKAKIEKLKSEHEKLIQRKLNLQDSFLDGNIDSEDFKEMKKRVEEQIFKVEETINSYQSEMSPFKEYLNKTLPMIQKLPSFWRKSDGKTKKKILGCIFRDKIENLDFKVATTPFTTEMSVLLGLEGVFDWDKNKKEVISDLFFKLAPPLGLEPRTP
ncbi:recombinase family protein [uncultured Algoriphagus sp.]|uniref:recombinase family protein n=1 Tax=uncultured Algoriphagus sp. TaxID=417365 RepID=UPI002599ABE5|nr:recombinase family protein [uncultured Algoriphagus sp.]